MSGPDPNRRRIAVMRPAAVRATLVVALALLAGCANTTAETGGPAGAPSPGPEGALRLAEATLNGGDARAAIDLYQRAAAADPEATEPRLGLARAYLAVGALPEARDAFAAVAGREPIEAARGLGRVALAQGDPVEAKARFGEVLKADPGDVTALNGVAVALDLEGRHREAQRTYAKALELAPTNRAVANNAALSLVLAGDGAAAVARLRELADTPMAPAAARHNLALALGLAGDAAAARDLLEGELDPAALDSNLDFYRAARGPGRLAPAAGIGE
jgi:Flp pilus assembly protein TadD